MSPPRTLWLARRGRRARRELFVRGRTVTAYSAQAPFPSMNPSPGIYEPARDDDAVEAERTWSTFSHLVGLLSLTSGGLPILGLIGAIVMWQLRKDRSPYLDDHGRESVNFQLSLLAYAVGGAVLGGIITVLTFGLGAVLFPLAWLAFVALQLVGCIRGAMYANRGLFYRYPMCIRFISTPSDAA